ncbi:MAG: 1-deoxy-D-xylulose-5-phosphate synthase [Candidatus Moranbacteria bacterium CG23_combo_of_CG06-09_8_20_14_all_35_22]|nr:MAG: 1-deoxy-D-xylulose-5-phosphate synthase [Candidatus Moranbacteria bacterium CG23_combo_of_CG06-09_8_20_14_all_35_22]
MEEKKTKKILDDINFPADLKKIPPEKLPELCSEVRNFLIESVSQSGGHFGSNLGVVELTVALHYIFDTPRDILIWDVGHQAYPHKMLTGRKEKLHTIRKYGGLAPFPKKTESEYDACSVGHTSTSISFACGMAIANRNKKNAPQIVAVIGDGALAGGMAFEALNHAGDIGADILVVLNDNKMSIAPNVGGLEKYLTRLISSQSFVRFRNRGRKILERIPVIQRFAQRAEKQAKGMLVPSTLFEQLGFEYYGPIDGHDVKTLTEVLENLKKIKGPRFLHVVTKKGKGYAQAEKDELSLHVVAPFDLATGQKNGTSAKKITYSDVFSDWICEKARKDEKLQAITPAMGDGSGLAEFRKKFPDRFFDVGIAEQHAVTFSAGLALQGTRPVVAIYSSFLQRAYDQIIHDIALENLDVLFAIDRAGIVGPDGATHNGSFDLSFLRAVPNLVIMTPSSENECFAMFNAGYKHHGPAVVRYPRGEGSGKYNQEKYNNLEIGKAKIIREGKNVAILSFGTLLENCKKTAQVLDASLVDMRFVKPLDEEMLKNLSQTHKYFVTIEDNVIAGGAGSAINEFLAKENLKVSIKNLGLPDKFLEHGTREELLAEVGLDEEGILEAVKSFFKLTN